MTSKTRQKRNYPEDFKRDAVALVTEQGNSLTEASRSLGVAANLIGRWKLEFEAQASDVVSGQDERQELERLRRESHVLPDQVNSSLPATKSKS